MAQVLRNVLILTSILCLLQVIAVAAGPANGDARALAIAANSIAAVTGGVQIQDISLGGTAQWLNGSQTESGVITLQALGSAASKMDATLPSGVISEVLDHSADEPTGHTFRTGLGQKQLALHNCWTDAVWFFPAFSSLSETSNPRFVFSYIGQETWEGTVVFHVRSALRPPYQSARTTASIQRLSTVDYYLDAASYLPVLVRFSTHPDDDSTVLFPVEIRYSDYALAAGGAKIAQRIQRLFNGVLQVDISLTSVNLNIGLQLSDVTK